MDFVNQAYSQIVELLRSMSAGTRIATALLLVVVGVSLAYLFQNQVTGGDEFLLGGRPFSASEMTAIEAAFAKAGLGKSQISGSQIRIPRGQKDAYLAALAEGNALPADFHTYLDDAIKSDNPFASPKSFEMRHSQAKQKSLSLIISRMQGIESATVHFDEETKRGLGQQRQKTAMVAVQSRSGQLDEDQVKAIRNVVASAYAGLDRRNITITDLSGATYGGAIGPDGMPEDESVYAAHKNRYEREFQRKIQQQLAYIPGVIVGVNAELNPEMQHSSQKDTVDPKPVTLVTKDWTKDATTKTPQLAGRPGAQSNGVGNSPVALQQTTVAGPESQITESRNDVQNIAGRDTTVTQIAPLIPKKVTASIDIPSSYYVEIWRKRNPQPADKAAKQPEQAELATIETETKNRIKETVRNLLPDVDKGTNPYPHIVVETYTDLPRPIAAAPSLAANAGTWLAENWQTVAVIGVGLMSLLMLRGMVRTPAPASQTATAAANTASNAPRLAIHEAGAEEDDPEPVKVLKTRFRASGPDLKAELQDIVKENPDAAATILRSWIGEAA